MKYGGMITNKELAMHRKSQFTLKYSPMQKIVVVQLPYLFTVGNLRIDSRFKGYLS